MAGIKTFEAPGCRISLCADKAYGVDKRYIPVKMTTTDGVFTEATTPATDNVIGVLQTEVKAGEAGQIAVSGVTYYASASALTAGDTIGKWGTVIVGCAANGVASVLIRPVTGA